MDAERIRLYRNRNMIAVQITNTTVTGDTMCCDTYITPAMAVMLSKALIDGAFDIMKNDLKDSKLSDTVLIDSGL